MANMGIIGAGSWGCALALLLHKNGHQVTVWSIMEDEIEMLEREHEHKDKLPGRGREHDHIPDRERILQCVGKKVYKLIIKIWKHC